jgi:hypothetical protein
MSESHSAAFLKEILGRAIDALAEGRRDHIYRRDFQTGRRVIWHFDNNLERLNACCEFDIENEEDYWGVVLDCLETAFADPVGSYKKPQEPTCSHSEAYGHEMFAFIVQLDDFTRSVYTKFCLIDRSDGRWYISIDCHT